MDFVDKLKVVLGDIKFWSALWAFVQVVLLYFFPDFPKELLAAANAFLGILFGLFFAAGVGESRAYARMQRQAKPVSESDKG